MDEGLKNKKKKKSKKKKWISWYSSIRSTGGDNLSTDLFINFFYYKSITVLIEQYNEL